MIINNICYIAELDQDIDDVLAAEYLHATIPTALKSVVLSPYPRTREGKQRLEKLQASFNTARASGYSDVKICKNIPLGTEVVLVGGPLTEVAKYITQGNSLHTLIMNGGFVGSNIVPFNMQLDKFKNKKYVRTFNFNCDIRATEVVLKSNYSSIGEIILVGKNVCHSERNTLQGDIWRNDKILQDICKRYNVRPNKRLHDILASKDGLQYIINSAYCICEYAKVFPINTGLNDNMTQWGSEMTRINGTRQYRDVWAAVCMKNEDIVQ